MWAPTQTHVGFSSQYASEIKKVVAIPIITVGRYTEPLPQQPHPKPSWWWVAASADSAALTPQPTVVTR